MSSDDEGLVSRDVVIAVLGAHGVDCYPSGGHAEQLVLAKDGRYETQSFPPVVIRKMLHRLSRLFGVPIHHFYHPEAVVAPKTEHPKVSSLDAKRKPKDPPGSTGTDK